MRSPNFGPRRGGGVPELVVVHYTAMATAAAACDRLCDPQAEVSAHWLISEQGEAVSLVSEDMRAWHAGAGTWQGRDDINSWSIGIELANTGDCPFPEPQMAALERLLGRIMARWSIPAANVIGHSDMAPLRKTDPGPRFDWLRLARQGLSVWPQPTTGPAPDAGVFSGLCQMFGYPAVDDASLLAVFRLRFRPRYEGPLDSTDMAMAADLAQRFGADGGPWRTI